METSFTILLVTEGIMGKDHATSIHTMHIDRLGYVLPLRDANEPDGHSTEWSFKIHNSKFKIVETHGRVPLH